VVHTLEQRCEIGVSDDGSCEYGLLPRSIVAMEECVQMPEIDIERPQAPAIIIDWPAGMGLIRVDGVEVAGSGHEFAATHPDADRAACK
jgi:hypothetical protein